MYVEAHNSYVTILMCLSKRNGWKKVPLPENEGITIPGNPAQLQNHHSQT